MAAIEDRKLEDRFHVLVNEGGKLYREWEKFKNEIERGQYKNAKQAKAAAKAAGEILKTLDTLTSSKARNFYA